MLGLALGTANAASLARSGIALGSELVTNGTFNSDTTGWSNPTGTVSWDASGQLKLAGAVNSTSGQTVSGLTVGKSYQISFTMTPSELNRARVNVVTNTTGSETFVANSTPGVPTTVTITRTGTTSVVFTAAAASNTNWASSGQYALFDNISVKQVLP